TPFVSGSLATIFSSVSCASATSCHAVGQYANSHNLASTFAATWNGSAWTRDTTPNPNGNNNLTGIACTSATRCLSIGYSAVPNWITLGMQVG
ncbi:MAG TPA: hypothetical protein VGS21_10940, partial [Acidimicrobiales bacterium]|nr:hypothetical protein [Acidimicrobiales bacterium]